MTKSAAKPKHLKRRAHSSPALSPIALRVNERLEELKLGDAPASLAAGLGKDAIRDIFRRPHQSPTLRTIVALAGVLKTSSAWLAFGDTGPTPPEPRRIRVVGEVAAGLFRLVGLSDETEHQQTWLPADVRYPAEAQFDLLVRGDSINRIARDGDYLRCVSLDAAGAAANGDLVIVERRYDHGGIETTAKRLRKKEDVVELWPDSTDDRWSTPIVIRRDHAADDEVVRIIAKVLFVHRPLGGRAD